MQVVKIQKRKIILNFVIIMASVAAGWYIKSKLTPPPAGMMGMMGATPHVLVEDVKIVDEIKYYRINVTNFSSVLNVQLINDTNIGGAISIGIRIIQNGKMSFCVAAWTFTLLHHKISSSLFNIRLNLFLNIIYSFYINYEIYYITEMILCQQTTTILIYTTKKYLVNIIY